MRVPQVNAIRSGANQPQIETSQSFLWPHSCFCQDRRHIRRKHLASARTCDTNNVTTQKPTVTLAPAMVFPMTERLCRIIDLITAVHTPWFKQLDGTQSVMETAVSDKWTEEQEKRETEAEVDNFLMIFCMIFSMSFFFTIFFLFLSMTFSFMIFGEEEERPSSSWFCRWPSPRWWHHHLCSGSQWLA